MNPDFPLEDYRRLSPDDRAAYLDHVKRLSPQDLRRRFLRSMSPAALEAHAARIEDPAYCVYAFCIDGIPRGVVEIACDEDGAEAALSVETDWRNRGLGRALLSLALQRARQIGQAKLRVLTTRDNVPMMRVAKSFGARFQDLGGEVIGTIDTPPATVTELMFDVTKESTDLFGAAIDLIGHSARAFLKFRKPAA